ncbi:MAG: TonB-dependent receptor [Acidobacteriota bacterium]|nr:TonB-dependent receptor [Acidobacteriota bacterium]
MTLFRGWVRGAVWMVLLVLGSFAAHGQEVSASISGTVIDPSGASVSGAAVTLTNTDRGQVVRTLATNKAGFYSASSLPLGSYSVTIASKGFKTATVTGLVLNANDQVKVDQRLSIGAATETVNIVASQAPINLENGMSEGLVTGTQIRELVLNNRNYEQLLTLQPGVSYGGTSDQLYIGVSLPAGTSNQVAFSVNGQRPTANNWTLDGADNVDRGANLTLLTFPSVDAIAEFNTLRGTYKAEFGRNASSQVNVVTRSGTDMLHGTAYEFFRNDLFNANNYFSNFTHTARPRLRYHDFGFAVGGPVFIPHFYDGRKHKTFFFYSQEFRRIINYSASTALVPTAAERTGDFSNSYVAGGGTAPVAVCSSFNINTGACQTYATTLNPSQIDPTAQAYLNDIYANLPLPPSATDLAAGLDPHALSANVRNVFNNTQEFARIDQAFGTRFNVFYRYLHDSLPSTEAGGLFVGGGLPGVQTTNTRAPGTQHLGHVTMALRPTMLVDMGYAYSSGAVISDPVGLASLSRANTTTPIQPSLPFASTLGIVPSISFSGSGSPTGIANAGIYRDYNRNHNGFGDITYTIRQHTLKFGLSYNHYQKQENALGNGSPYPQGLFTFGAGAAATSAQLTALGAVAPSTFDATFANFLIGNASGGTSNGFQQGSIAATPNLNENLIELYGQDDWRVSRRLTVNLGVRYSYFGQPYDDNSQLSNFDPNHFYAANTQTIDSNGQLCTTAGQTSAITVGVNTTYTLNNCLNVNGLNSYQANPIADPLNGIILASTTPVKAFNEAAGAPSTSTHGSPFGLEVGHAEKRDWAPRVGFALDVFGNGKTAVRGGYGIAYDQSPTSIYEQSIFNNIPYVTTVSYPSARLNGTAGTYPVANLTPPTLYGTPVNYQTPYVQQFSVDIQQALSPTTTLDIGYFGDHGTHLQGRIDINEVQPGLYAQDGIAYNGSGFRPVLLYPLATNGTSASGNLACTSNTPGSCALNIFTIPTGCAGGFVSSACENPLNQIRPYRGYGPINTVRTIFNSNYNALQVKFTRRFSGKSLIDANYTFSKALTNAQTDYSSAPQNIYNLEPEYGRSSYDRHDILTVDGIWELPWMRDQRGLMGHVLGGWEMSGLWTVNSGLPLTATMSANTTVDYNGIPSLYNSALSNGGVANDSGGLGIIGPSAASLRPSQVLNPNFGYGVATVHTRGTWFNPTAFIAPPPSSVQVGNERRGVINGPGFYRVDVGLFRNFRIYKETSFQLRGEAFNVLNHTNWATVCTSTGDCNPTASTVSAKFGGVTSARDPRILQVAGKFNF